MWPMGLILVMTLTFEFSTSTVTLTFYHMHGLDQGFSWSNFEIAVPQNGRADWHWTKGVGVGHSWPFGDHLVTKVRYKDLPDSDPGDIICRHAIDSSSFSNWWLKHLLWNCPQLIVTGPHWWWVNIGSGNGLVLSCNKPLSEPVLTQIYVTIWRQ